MSINVTPMPVTPVTPEMPVTPPPVLPPTTGITISPTPTNLPIDFAAIARQFQPQPLPPLPNNPQLPPTVPITTTDQAKEILLSIERATGVKPALIYVSFVPSQVRLSEDFGRQEAALTNQYEQHLNLPNNQAPTTLTIPPGDDDQLELLLIIPDKEPIRVRVPQATRKQVLATAKEFYEQVSDVENNYLPSAQQLYQWLLAPLMAIARQNWALAG